MLIIYFNVESLILRDEILVWKLVKFLIFKGKSKVFFFWDQSFRLFQEENLGRSQRVWGYEIRAFCFILVFMLVISFLDIILFLVGFI